MKREDKSSLTTPYHHDLTVSDIETLTFLYVAQDIGTIAVGGGECLGEDIREV